MTTSQPELVGFYCVVYKEITYGETAATQGLGISGITANGRPNAAQPYHTSDNVREERDEPLGAGLDRTIRSHPERHPSISSGSRVNSDDFATFAGGSMMERARLFHQIVGSRPRTEITFTGSHGLFRTFYGTQKKIGVLMPVRSEVEGEDPKYYVDVSTTTEDWPTILKGWDALAKCLGDVLFHVSSGLHRLQNEEPSGEPLQALSQAADVAIWLEREYTGMVHRLLEEDASVSPTNDEASVSSQKIRRRMIKLREYIRHDLVGRVNDLFSRTSDILTIEVGRRTYAQNSSVKRLAWVNIIFLPMIFASGIFGMNVGPFKNYPDLAMYVAFSIPLSIFVFVTIYASRKYYAILRWIQPYTRSLHRNLATRPVDPERGVLLSPRPAPSRDASAPAADGSTTLERRLTHAIAEDARGTVQQLLPRLNLRSDRRLSDLLCNKAAAVGAKEILHLLLDNGACIDGFEASRGFPLLAATEAGREDTVKELTKRGADVWRAKPDGEDCFIVAARKGSCEILKLLLDRVKVNRESVASRLNTTVPYFFRKHELQNRRFQNWNVYQHAVSSGNLNCIKLLINRQQKIARQITPSDEKSLLMFESVYRNLNLLKYLVEESGADPDHSDKQSRNCLFHAASFLQKKVSTVGTGSDASTHVLGVMKWLAKHKERTLPVSELKKRLKPTILLLVDIHRFLNPENQQVCRQLLEWILITKSFGLNSRWMIGPCSISCLAYSVWKKDREMILWLVGRGAGTTEHDFKDTGITENDQIHYINSTEYAIATCTDTDKDEKDIEIVLALLSRSHGKIAIPTIQDGSGHIKHVLPYDFAATHGKTELAKAIADLRDGNERVPLRQAGGNDGEELEQQWWDVEAQGPSIGGPSGEESAWIGSSSASQGNTGEHTGHEAFELQPMQPSP